MNTKIIQLKPTPNIKGSNKAKASNKTFALALIRNPFPIWPTPAA